MTGGRGESLLTWRSCRKNTTEACGVGRLFVSVRVYKIYYALFPLKKSPAHGSGGGEFAAWLGCRAAKFKELLFDGPPRKSAGDADILALIYIKDGAPDGMIRITFLEVVLCLPECSPETRSVHTRNL
jgi:hypothetical protein